MAQKLVADLCDEFLKTSFENTQEFQLSVIQSYIAICKEQGIHFPQRRLKIVYEILQQEIQEVLQVRTYGTTTSTMLLKHG